MRHGELIEALTGFPVREEIRRQPSPEEIASRKAHKRRMAAASSVTGAPGGGFEMVQEAQSVRDAIRQAMDER